MKYSWLLTFVSSFLFTVAFAQQNSYLIDKNYNGLNLPAFINKAEQNLNVHFFYQKDSLPVDLQMVVENDSASLEQVLSTNLKPYRFFATVDASGNIFLTRGAKLKTSLPPGFFNLHQSENFNSDSSENSQKYLTTKKEIGVKTIYVGNKKEGAYLESVKMSGYMTSKTKGGKVIGATMYFSELKSGVVTDENGFYSIQLKKGRYTLTIRSMEYEEKKFRLEVYSDAQINFALDEKVSALKEVVITASASNKLKNTSMGYEKISAKSIKLIPKMMGENDIVKTALLLPGVQAVGEGTAGYNVRGGSADQNAFYLNQIPVYNTSHLLGFFTAFTPNAIDELTIYKGNFPAQFGGHLSSVFDITAREGNNKKFTAEGGISPVSANLMVDGPINKGKGGYMVGVRSTYSTWALKLVQVDAIRNSRAKFNDGVVNIHYKLTDNNKLSATGYYSSDGIVLASLTDYDYHNAGASLKWTHFFKQKHNFELSGIYSNYGYNERNSSSDIRGYKVNYGLNHMEAKAGVSLNPNAEHHIHIGANSVLYKLDQGNYNPLDDKSLVIPVKLNKEEGLESGLYMNEEWKPSAIFSLSAGIRYNFYTFFGPHTSYVYRDDSPLISGNIVDTVNFGKNKKVKSYSAPDFRLSAKYSINEFMSVKAAFNQAHQYIFMLSNTIAIAPTDKWKLVDDHIKPMMGRQYSLGFFSELKKHKYEFSTELYYKETKNLVEYKDGANLLVNKIPETDVLQGNLNSYGAEFMLKKMSGKLSGWITYTYSRAIVKIDGERADQKINLGKAYPANYDKPHAVNFVANYKLSHRVSVSSNFVYSTGRPITFPSAVYYQQGIPIVHYSSRNEYRIPDYIRVDVSVNLEGNLKARKFKHSSWSLSVYNLLGRDNPYSVYFKQEGTHINGYQLAIFGSPIFSLTYNFKLGSFEGQ
ncbi:MAG TPA: carboxypeptidase-like regulatory domain-containing protein [Bacteroidia bacterium]|nr:carboxypeptidase-like regulatory domain-containing protein [Bacteroidia bacterium]HRG53009.1 carboxypeptidase-like regulatory domain-containing protein [Bacteroidia bacterium]